MKWRVPPWADGLVIGAALLIMLVWSWGTWPDPLIDFGRELYTPWQLSQGKVLYRDVQSFYGPLSPYVNAACFTLFGASLRTLVLCNLTVLIMLIGMLYVLFQGISGRIGATLACLVFVALFSCAQLVAVGNYNYVCPYSHEAVHGLTLSIASMLCLRQFVRSRRRRWALLAGLALGTVFLTKPESFLAAAPAVMLGMAIALWKSPRTIRAGLISLAGFACCVLIPPLVALLLLSTAMPGADALRSVLGSWPFLRDDRLTSLPFFRQGMGIDDPSGNIKIILQQTGIWLAALAPAALVALLTRTTSAIRLPLAIAVFVCSTVVLWLLNRQYVPVHLAAPLPLVVLIVASVSGWSVVRVGRTSAIPAEPLMRLVFSVFAMVYLSKMILATRFFHYGFVLAMPGALLTVVALVQWIPQWIDRRGGTGLVFRGGALAAMAIVLGVHLWVMDHWWSQKTATLGHGADAFRTQQAHDEMLNQIMNAVSELPEVHSVTVLPEGVMLNYLMRIPTSSAYLTFLPPDLIMFDEQRMLQSLRNHPPDVILLANRNTAEYGARTFGQDYGQEIQNWIAGEYRLVRTISEPGPASPRKFSVQIMRRNAENPKPATTMSRSSR